MNAHQPNLEELTGETQRLWDEKAAFWDEQMGEGNAFQRLLIAPSAERLLQVQPDQRILDVACGNGVFARRLAQLGAQVVATDFSARFLELAQAHTTEHGARIEYKLVDATNEDQLLALGKASFDAAVCNMALMDMPTIQPLARALSQLLKHGGACVCSVPHPAFNTTATRMVVEQEERDAQLVVSSAIKVSNYLHLPPTKGIGMLGEPVPHYNFDRPLSQLLPPFFAAGFMLDGIEEPTFDAAARSEQPFSWTNFPHIPPVLVVRLRLV